MATIPIIRPKRISVVPVVALALAVLLFAISSPSRHAILQHGSNAHAVTRRFGRLDPDNDDKDFWQKDCPDGRWYTFKRLPTKEGKVAWDVSIDYEEAGMLKNITRFTCSSKDWIARKLAWCE